MWVANEQIVNGRPSAQPLRGLFGGVGPARAWNDIIGDIQKEMGEEARSFGRLPSIVRERPDDDEPTDPDNPEPDEPTVTPDDPEEDITPVVKPPENTTRPPANTTGTTGSQQGGGNDGGGEDVVYVSVCADSGQRANAYCPETVRRPFFKGSEPKGGCPLHGATASRITVDHLVLVDWLHDVRHSHSHREPSYSSQPDRSAHFARILRDFHFSALDAANRSI